jgi:translation initiation factor 4B
LPLNQIVSVRLVSGQDGKPKGFGYVEFAKADDLRNALSATGQDLNGRPTRISVAEAPSQQIGRADAESTWTRKGPLESLPGRSGGFGGARSGGFGGGFGSGASEEVEREGPIRGGRFQPSAPAPTAGRMGGGGFGSGERREFQPAREVEVEREGPIRGGKFQPTPEREQRSGGIGFGGERRGPPGAGAEPSRADEGSWTRSGPLPPRENQNRPSFGDRTRKYMGTAGNRLDGSADLIASLRA